MTSVAVICDYVTGATNPGPGPWTSLEWQKMETETETETGPESETAPEEGRIRTHGTGTVGARRQTQSLGWGGSNGLRDRHRSRAVQLDVDVDVDVDADVSGEYMGVGPGREPEYMTKHGRSAAPPDAWAAEAEAETGCSIQPLRRRMHATPAKCNLSFMWLQTPPVVIPEAESETEEVWMDGLAHIKVVRSGAARASGGVADRQTYVDPRVSTERSLQASKHIGVGGLQ
ncbi:hypothetical protein B0H14DRAFT_3168757 [Mycena olivaceomarginata]|nr:hypothetical protein B0H14DRAFT_3168757 [Mycena olivaceomarginata]